MAKMLSSKLSVQGKEEPERTIRVLAFKVAQVIVQSRSGHTINCPSNPNSPGDWFNLSIKDSPEILTETKRSLRDDLTTSSIPLCIEISVNTEENRNTVLENWSFRVLPQSDYTAVKVTDAIVYSRMGTLLKSLLSVTRMTPAYKISRRPCPESYTICYRVFMGDPKPYGIGVTFKHIRVGQVCAEDFTIHLAVSYRTEVTFSPSPICTSPHSVSPKDEPDSSAKLAKNRRNEARRKLSRDTMIVGNFIDRANKQLPSIQETDIPFGNLLPACQSPASSATSSSSGSDTYDGNNASYKSLTSPNSFIMLDLNTPFAKESPLNDLRMFYSQCQTAPELKAFAKEQTLQEQIGNLTTELANFEMNMHVFDDFVDNLRKPKTNDS